MSGDRPMQLAGRVTRLLCMSGQWMPTMVSSHPKLVSHETCVRLRDIAYDILGVSPKRFGGSAAISSLRATTIACILDQ